MHMCEFIHKKTHGKCCYIKLTNRFDLKKKYVKK